jgi:hypothetical protein
VLTASISLIVTAYLAILADTGAMSSLNSWRHDETNHRPG